MYATASLAIPTKKYRSDSVRNRLVLSLLGVYTLALSLASLLPAVIDYIKQDAFPPSLLTPEVVRLGVTSQLTTTIVTSFLFLLPAALLCAGFKTQAEATHEFAPRSTGRLIAYTLAASHLAAIAFFLVKVSSLIQLCHPS